MGTQANDVGHYLQIKQTPGGEVIETHSYLSLAFFVCLALFLKI